MTRAGDNRKISNLEAGYAQSGKLIVVIDNLRLNSGVEKAILMRNNGPNIVFLAQIERFESELISFLADGLASIDLDLIFTPDLSGTSESALSEASVYRITDKGDVSDVDPELFDIVELTGFIKAAAGNKKIEVGNNEISFFTSNQSTTVAQAVIERFFEIPYAIEPGGELVVFFTNEVKIGVLDADADLVMSGYSVTP